MPYVLTVRLASEHLDELSFLLCDRRIPLESPGLGPGDLFEAEERIEAHLDGLRFAGEPAHELLVESLGSGDQDTVRAAAYALASISEFDGGLDAAVAAFARAEDQALPVYQAALKHASHGVLGKRLAKLLEHERALIRESCLEMLAYRRELDGRTAVPFLEDVDPAVRRAAIAAIAAVGEPADAAALERVALSGRESCAPEAMIALLRLGSVRALEACRSAVSAGGGGTSPLMLTALALAGGPGDRKLLESKLRQPELKVAAAEALGIHGGLESVAPLLQLLEEKEESVRLAAARSLYMLAGAGPTETVDVPPDEEEPIEDATTSAPSGRPGAVPAHAAKVTKVSTGAPAWREWWEAHRASFEPGLRHRRGKPFALGRCIADLESPGRTLAIRRRTQWELEIRSGQRFPFEPDAFVVRQKEGLAAWQAWWKENSARFPAGTWPFAGGAAV